MGRWKRCAEIGIVALMTALVVKTGKEQEWYPSQPGQEQQPSQRT